MRRTYDASVATRTTRERVADGNALAPTRVVPSRGAWRSTSLSCAISRALHAIEAGSGARSLRGVRSRRGGGLFRGPDWLVAVVARVPQRARRRAPRAWSARRDRAERHGVAGGRARVPRAAVSPHREGRAARYPRAAADRRRRPAAAVARSPRASGLGRSAPAPAIARAAGRRRPQRSWGPHRARAARRSSRACARSLRAAPGARPASPSRARRRRGGAIAHRARAGVRRSDARRDGSGLVTTVGDDIVGAAQGAGGAAPAVAARVGGSRRALAARRPGSDRAARGHRGHARQAGPRAPRPARRRDRRGLRRRADRRRRRR